MKTLHLNLKKKWFDMILSGDKKEEYRQVNKYWTNRLISKSDAKIHPIIDFDTITFSNGYAKNRRQFVIQCLNLYISTSDKIEWGAEPGKKYFILILGEILKKTNC